MGHFLGVVAIDSHLFVAYMGANFFFNCFYHHAWRNTLLILMSSWLSGQLSCCDTVKEIVVTIIEFYIA